MVAMCVVKRRSAEADLNIGSAAMTPVRVGDSSVLGGDADCLIVRYSVAKEVRLGLRVFGIPYVRCPEGCESALQFGFHGLHQDRILGSRCFNALRRATERDGEQRYD